MSGSPARGLTVALGLLVAASLAVAEPMADLERLGRVLKSQPGWTAPYRQIYVAAGMTGGDEVEGTVWLAWPSRARFVSGPPIEAPIVKPSNGGCRVELTLVVDQRVQRNVFDVGRDGSIEAGYRVLADDLPLPIAR